MNKLMKEALAGAEKLQGLLGSLASYLQHLFLLLVRLYSGPPTPRTRLS